MKVCWFSTGVSSFVACYLAKDIDKIIYTHVEDQHPDSLRFLHDCEVLLERKIETIQSDKYKDVNDVIEKTKYVNGAYGASCTKWLKKQVRKDWEKENPDHHVYVWGYDVNEKHRAEEITATFAGPPAEDPQRLFARSIKKLEIPVLSRNAPNMINTTIYFAHTLIGVFITPVVV